MSSKHVAQVCQHQLSVLIVMADPTNVRVVIEMETVPISLNIVHVQFILQLECSCSLNRRPRVPTKLIKNETEQCQLRCSAPSKNCSY